jgi:hypothetical protein
VVLVAARGRGDGDVQFEISVWPRTAVRDRRRSGAGGRDGDPIGDPSGDESGDSSGNVHGGAVVGGVPMGMSSSSMSGLPGEVILGAASRDAHAGARLAERVGRSGRAGGLLLEDELLLLDELDAEFCDGDQSVAHAADDRVQPEACERESGWSGPGERGLLVENLATSASIRLAGR